jgi:hypothetical protein
MSFNKTYNLFLEKYSVNSGFVIPFSFPEYQPKVQGNSLWDQFIGLVSRQITSGTQSGTYGKLGHGGVATVDDAGNVMLFEFGRYPGAKRGYGLTIQKKVNVRAQISDKKITNLQNVVTAVKRSTRPPGPSLAMTYVSIAAPNVTEGIRFARSKVTSPQKYEIFDFSNTDEDANCATFASEVVRRSGVWVPPFCAPTPALSVAAMAVYGYYGTA